MRDWIFLPSLHISRDEQKREGSKVRDDLVEGGEVTLCPLLSVESIVSFTNVAVTFRYFLLHTRREIPESLPLLS